MLIQVEKYKSVEKNVSNDDSFFLNSVPYLSTHFFVFHFDFHFGPYHWNSLHPLTTIETVLSTSKHGIEGEKRIKIFIQHWMGIGENVFLFRSLKLFEQKGKENELTSSHIV